MRHFCNSAFALVAFTCLLVALPARAANDIQPGLWQDTETGEVNGQKQPPKVTTECSKPEEAKDIVKKARAEMQASAKELGEMQQARHPGKGQRRHLRDEVRQPADGRQHGNVDDHDLQFADQHHERRQVAVMSFGGQKMSSNLTTQSRYIGPCK
jgi:hypothetical protein